MTTIFPCALIVILLSFPTVIYAADTAAIAAALPDEASECRYLLMLCQQTRSATQNTHRAGQTLIEKVPAAESKQGKYREAKSKAKNKEQALQEAGKGGSITATRDARGTLMLYPKKEGSVWERKHEEWKKANAEEVKAHHAYLTASSEMERAKDDYEVARSISTKNLEDTLEAAKVIRIKHEKVPGCFQECSDILNMENYK